MTNNESILQVNSKTSIRKKLEELEDDIHKSWLRDLDKVAELQELVILLEQIYQKDNIEDFFENSSDFDYFCKKFTTEVLCNILRQHIVYGQNGDEIALDIIFGYLKILHKFMDRSQYIPLWDSIKDIFDDNKSFYKGVLYGNNRIYNEKKLISSEKYNELFLTRKINAETEVKEGMEIDVLFENRKPTSFNNEKKIWTRGIVTKLEREYFTVRIAEDTYPIYIKINSFEYSSAGSMTKDYEWRMGLKQNDNIDCWDRGRWFPATILIRKEENVNGLKKVDYRIGFRVYPKFLENWEEYKKYWPNKDLAIDSNGKEFLGDIENIDEWIASYSKRIQLFNTNINNESKCDNYESENYFIDDLVKFRDGMNKTYIIGRNNNFSYFFSRVLKFFAELGGFEKMVSLLSNKEKPHPDIVQFIFYIIGVSSPFFHKEYIFELGKNLYDNVLTYMNEMTQNDLRNMRKETFDNMTKVLRFYLGLTLGSEQRNKIIEKFSISFAIKMIKTTFLEKRITAIKTITDVIKSCKLDEDKKFMILRLIEENQIFYEIYGPNSHIQLINKSKDLLEIMLKEDKLSDGEMEMIWTATKKGDLEGKLTILRTLKEISKSLQPKHIKALLENIYNSQGVELIDEEIDLIYELSTHSSQSDEVLERCIKFFTQSLLLSNSDESEKTQILINKIFDITKYNPSFKTSVISMTIDSLEKNENVNLSLKILQKYLKDSDLESDYDLNRLLIQDNRLVNTYCDNFIKYVYYVKDKAKGWTQDIDLLPLKEFSHSQNIRARLNFLNCLISQRLWNSGDPIEFVYNNLIEIGKISEKDKQEFYIWISKSIEKYVDYETEEKIFKLFNEKICKDLTSCQQLSIQAFDTYLKIFFDINSKNSNLTYSLLHRENKFELSVYTHPESLIGFEILWKIVFESFSHDIMNKGIEILHSIYTNVYNNKEDSNISYSQMLLQKCLNLIRETISSNKKNEEKFNIVKKCLYFLKLMIEESEKRGTAGVKSHSGLLKKKIFNLKISSSLRSQKDFDLRIYGNTTIWELKEIIAKNSKYCLDFLKININGYELKSSDNGKTLIELELEDNDEIKISSNGMEKLIPQSDLTNDGNILPEVVSIFNEWFDKYSVNDKMTKELCAKFVSQVTNTKDEIKEDDHRINSLFMLHDKNRDDLLERDEFVAFYTDCATTPSKKKVTWENLRNMGVRNDLKKFDDPYQTYNDDKTILPRYELAYNEEFFNTIFYLQDLSEDIALEAFNFLETISTNPNIHKQLLKDSEWKSLLDERNIYKLIYSLKIIESFIEDIEIEAIEGQRNNSDEMKIWMKNFVEHEGYMHLVNILQNKLVEFVKAMNSNENPSVMNNICVQFLLKIIKIFYLASLNRYNDYKKTKKLISKNNEIDELENLFTSDLGDIILKSLDYHNLLNNLSDLLNHLINKKNKSSEEINIIQTSYEFITILIPYSSNYEKDEKIILENRNFISISLYGILNNSSNLRSIFSNSLIKLCKLLEFSNKFNIIVYLFKNIFELIENISKEIEKNSNELFEFYSYLLEIYLSNRDKFMSIDIDPKSFVKKLTNNLLSDINNEENSIVLSNELFVGYIKILIKVVENDEEMKEDISNRYNIIQAILTKVLFKQTSSELNEKLSKIEFVNPDILNDNKSSRNSNQLIRNACFNFILCLLKNSIDNFEKFFSTNVLEEKKEEKKELSSKYQLSMYQYKKNEGFVGLRNLGCICYMNSMLQQFFLVPSLRYNLLTVDDNQEANTNNPYNIDDNLFHQVQRMFSFLELSERMDYNPHGFCYSFKDWDGNPTNTSIQQDSQEFLNVFLDKMENHIKPTRKKYVFQSVYGGKTCSQLICESGCGSVKNRFEDFYTLSLEVNNMKTLKDSLENFIQPEKIDEYNCDQCKKKVTITKKNSISTLPNVLIIHLKRLFFNYETDRNEKINSRLEFPKVLNMKDFTIEELTRKNISKVSKEDGVTVDIETDEIYFKHSIYYEYHLVGVVVHWGSADSGHYYSYINTTRGGKENESIYNPNDESHINNWLEFNDSSISKFNINKLEDECYGGNYDTDKDKEMNWAHFRTGGEKIKSAYMLVYERRIKSPIKILVDSTENSVSFKEEESAKIRKDFDICKYYDTPDYNTVKEKINNTTFYDAAKDEYFILRPFYSDERLIPKKYYLEIIEDNTIFQKQQNTSDEQFINFFDNVINVLDETMSNLKEIKMETSVKISLTFMNFIFNILSQKDKQQLLKPAKDKFIHMVESQPVCLIPVWEYISDHLKQLGDNLLNENELVVQNNSEMIYELIKLAYEQSPEKFTSTDAKDDNIQSRAIRTLDYIISLFPKVQNKYISKIAPILLLLRKVSLLDGMLKYFAEKETIFTFITFLLGKDSPCYSDTLKGNENWDNGRLNIQGCEAIIELIYDIYTNSVYNKIDNIENPLMLSERDLKCLKNPNFLKFIFKNTEKIFSTLLFYLNFEDEDFTYESCIEITKFIDDISYYNDSDFPKLFYSIVSLLGLKDSHQRLRFEILIGIPQIVVEENPQKYFFPLIGYHNLCDERSKHLEYKGLVNIKSTCTILKKIIQFKSKGTSSIQVFLALLDACTENYELLKYIRKLPAEELRYESFIDFGISMINTYSAKNDNNIYFDKLSDVVQKINPIMEGIMSDNNILNGHKGFIGRYLIKDIKREEISLIKQIENIYIFQIDYYTNTIDDSDVDYTNSKSYINGSMKLLDDEESVKKESTEINEEENIKSLPNNYARIQADNKINFSEREFFKKILPNFNQYKKIIIENIYSVPNHKHTLRRYVCFNNSNKDVTIEFKIKRMSSVEEANEYIPSGGITLQVTSQTLKNVYMMPKIDENSDWSDGGELDFEFIMEFMIYKPMVNYNDGYYPGYSQQYNQGYPPLNPYSGEGYNRLSEIDEDDDI